MCSLPECLEVAVAPPGVLVELQALQVAQGQEHLLLLQGRGSGSIGWVDFALFRIYAFAGCLRFQYVQYGETLNLFGFWSKNLKKLAHPISQK